MTVTLLNYTPLNIADFAISKCWDKSCDMDNPNTEKISRVANKFKHASTIEHLTYNFDIDGISRACLQELARHRMANLSVKSTRYTLKELRDWGGSLDHFLVSTGNEHVDLASAASLGMLQTNLKKGISNDVAKYSLPESYKTSLVWTINARSLQNFLYLRTNKSALWEIRELAHKVFKALPEDHRFLFQEHIN